MKPSNLSQLDRFAILLSGVCLVHCLAIPVALLVGPALGLWLAETETTVHWTLFGIALPLSLIALGMGYRRHRSVLVLALGMLGLGLMFVGVAHWFGATWEVVFTTAGVVLVMWAHIRNAMAAAAH